MSSRIRGAVLATILLLPAMAMMRSPAAGAESSAADARRRERTTWDSVFSAAQAERGQATYARTCQRCHTATLAGADESPALAGGAFLSNWSGQSLHVLHDRILSSMPSDTPGVYTRAEMADVIAYVLSFNGFPAGASELQSSSDSLKAILLTTMKP